MKEQVHSLVFLQTNLVQSCEDSLKLTDNQPHMVPVCLLIQFIAMCAL